ncbi:MAG TPA: SDR family oxidoreductase [Anaerolineales bacterium]|nr:SDR family oxidoreductase [Anaerolineales bacterium]
MKNKICMITGASSGIGKATALGLAKMGATVVMLAHNQSRGEAALEDIKGASGNSNVELLVADLASQAEIRQLVQDFKQRHSQLHVLINNAGIAPVQRSVTNDGIERVLAVNYLAPFLLTNLLLDTLKSSAPARVVNVAGEYHRKVSIQFDDLMSEQNYNGNQASNQAKLALILFTYELARRLEGTGVTVNCLHPGAVATDAPLKDPHLSSSAKLMYKLVRLFFLSPEKGAQTSIYLASSPELEHISGNYFIKHTPVKSSAESYDEKVARRLWEISAQLTKTGS